jgi:hypothetical protein
MLLRRALIRPAFAYHQLLTLSMAYVALPQGAEFFRKFPNCPKTHLSWSFPSWSGANPRKER